MHTEATHTELVHAWARAFIIYPVSDETELGKIALMLPRNIAALSGDALLAAVKAWLFESGVSQNSGRKIAEALEAVFSTRSVHDATSGSSKAVTPPADRNDDDKPPARTRARARPPAAPAVRERAPATSTLDTTRAAAAAARKRREDEAAAAADDVRLIEGLVDSRAFWAATRLRPHASTSRTRDGAYELVVSGAGAADDLELTADFARRVVAVSGVVAPAPHSAERAELARACLRVLARFAPRRARHHGARAEEIGAALRRLGAGRFGRIDERLELPADALVARAQRVDAAGGADVVLRVPSRGRRVAPRPPPPRAARDPWDYEQAWPPRAGLAAGGPGLGLW